MEEYGNKLPVYPVRLRPHGIDKQIFFGYRDGETSIEFLRAFIDLASESSGK